MKTKKILSEYSYKPKKAMAQNFLVNEKLLDRISQLANLGPEDTVVEIGAGPGNLTRRLARFAGKVFAIEAEEELTLICKAELKDENVELIHMDALTVDYRSLAPAEGKLKVVANLPYNITTPILFKLLETPDILSEMLLLVQAEVATRIAAEPGSKEYGILSVFMQLYADTKVLTIIGPEVFKPKPKVNSALLRLKMLDQLRAQVDDLAFFKRVVKAAFGMRRKTLKNALLKNAGLGLEQQTLLEVLEDLDIDPVRRAETLSIKEFADLANSLRARMDV